MSQSLRKRLTRRQARSDGRGVDSDGGSVASSTQSVVDAPFVQDQVIHAMSDDVDETPPPPQSPTIRRVSPSSTFLDRYKSRAPAAVAPTVSPTTASGSREERRQTHFSEDFDRPQPGSAPVTDPDTPTREHRDPFKVHGEKHHVLTAEKNGKGLRKISSAEVMPIVDDPNNMTLEEGAVQKRMTRSQSRRKERADSATVDLTLEDVDDPETSAPIESTSDDKPAKLNIHKLGKKEASHTPSPTTTSEQPTSSDTPASTAANSPPRRPSSQKSNATSHTDKATLESFPTPGKIGASCNGNRKSPVIALIPQTPKSTPAQTRLRDLVKRRSRRSDGPTAVVGTK